MGKIFKALEKSQHPMGQVKTEMDDIEPERLSESHGPGIKAFDSQGPVSENIPAVFHVICSDENTCFLLIPSFLNSC